MEFVEPVLLALAAGAAVGAGETASTAVQDAYRGLKTATGRVLRRKVTAEADDAEVEAVVEERLADPGTHRDELEAALTRADPEERAELLVAARRLLDLVDPEDPALTKYRVELRDNKGVQVGDHNTQTNHFGA
ncbi:hypothetical protein B0I31_112178 [Saccharothrix carnea]|uniref:RHIM domain-containing protein n=1 Tax=Saccharothrix carnea TaxID=1280637 RepID=A0A2P8I2L8_SACCR|nr:hypothetical protein [Saccharothrix carnea]PSL52709.1 hypothetical protein B0I31_112178 [Saccharothrix carnea]